MKFINFRLVSAPPGSTIKEITRHATVDRIWLTVPFLDIMFVQRDIPIARDLGYSYWVFLLSDQPIEGGAVRTLEQEWDAVYDLHLSKMYPQANTSGLMPLRSSLSDAERKRRAYTDSSGGLCVSGEIDWTSRKTGRHFR